MKLRKARVTNYRSVNDSGEFSITDLTCLVGKNESGKTTILQALAGLQPIGDDRKLTYDKQRDYPRRHLTQYAQRHGGDEAGVLTTTWELDDDDVAVVEGILGPGCLESRLVEVVKYYGGQRTWAVNIAEPKVVAYLVEDSGLSKPERSALKTRATIRELYAALASKDSSSSAAQMLMKRIDGFRNRSPGLAAIDVLAPRAPRFLYFSNYNRMVGSISLDQLTQAKSQKSFTPEQSVYLDFLDFAGTTPEALAQASRYEEQKTLVEAASIAITDQIFEYWSQNRHLAVQFEVADGRPNDSAPLNSGRVMHARVWNDIHKMSVPFDDRSAGFIWFFSFLVVFSQAEKDYGNAVILLDEPGLNLHATAQADLLRYIREKLLPNHQVIYTTHSPFMVPADDLASVRTVEDVLREGKFGRAESLGTKVNEDVLSTDRETLFPLQGALGYEITQSLFVGEHTLLVEGPSEILYFQAMTSALERRYRKGLDRRWTPCPSNGVDKVNAFLSLFGGNKLHCAVLLDLAAGQKSKVQKVRELENSLLRKGHVFTVAEFLGTAEADIEDLFHPDLYAQMVNGAYALEGERALTGDQLRTAEGTRLVQKAERLVNAVLPPDEKEMSHYAPALWLIQHPGALADDLPEVMETLNNFEKVFEAFNRLI
jgi:predicted ATPase